MDFFGGGPRRREEGVYMICYSVTGGLAVAVGRQFMDRFHAGFRLSTWPTLVDGASNRALGLLQSLLRQFFCH